jgi:hypothetical protein
MKFAYADPPYIGQARKHYSHDERCAEVDHVALIEQLRDGGYAGWALSLSAPSTEEVMHICRRVVGPNVVRLGAWVKPFASFKPNVNPGYCWEPVVFVASSRKRSRKELTVRDYVSANITVGKGLSGAKPDGFSFWLFDLLGMEATDELDDLFPGTGAVTRAWKEWSWHRGAA